MNNNKFVEMLMDKNIKVFLIPMTSLALRITSNLAKKSMNA